MYLEKKDNDTRTFFKRNELKELFSDFNIIHYFEGIIPDKGHPGKPEPHTHGVVEIIAQEVGTINFFVRNLVRKMR